ncbi:MAG: thioredoxin-like domain-containing protein [Bryobacteraceae bacterium]
MTNSNPSTGVVQVNGADTRRPGTPFDWDWGDGSTARGFFPQAHVYTNTKQGYILRVTSHEDDGSTDCAQLTVTFPAPTNARTSPGTANTSSAAQLPPEAQEYMDRGRAAMNRGQYQEAIGEFRHVLKISSNYAACYLQLVRAYSQLDAHKDALETARKLLEVVQDDRSRAIAHNLIGVEISALAKKGKMRREEAEREFRLALDLDPSQAVAHFNLGAELLKEQRDEEGIAELNEYLKMAPQGSSAKDAHDLIENPRRARETFVPADFALVTKDGEYVTPDDVKGKVVLLDFWASWCKPCEASLPTLQHLFKHYDKQEFLLISISTDQNEEAWQRFLSSHHMEWPQAHDRDSKLQRMFDVRVIPTWVLIDAEGVVRSYATGSGSDSMAQIEDAIKKNLKNAQKLRKTAAVQSAPRAAVCRIIVGGCRARSCPAGSRTA